MRISDNSIHHFSRLTVRLLTSVLLPILFLPTACTLAAGDPTLEAKVDNVLKQMTIEEKVGLCSGGGAGFRGVPRLNIPGLRLTDGPRGAHDGGPCTAFPSGVLFGATWDPDLIGQAGKVIGREMRAVGDGILLGPSINIQRDPLGGRFFEYYTEDPYLNGRLAAAIVTGIQSEGVAACLKHYVCNNREDNRNMYMSMVDARTLSEIYFPAFKAAVQEGHAWAVMTSANGVNGDFVSDSKLLLNDTLKGEWDFDGMVLTDWLQTRSTEKAAFAGLDISMPGGKCGFAQPLLDAVNADRVPVSVIDDKARRVLRVFGRIGLMDNRNLKDGAQRNTREHQALARQVAAGGIVLLKNEHSLLPLNPDRLKRILVLGPNADTRFCIAGLGGSSWVEGPYEVTTLAGIRQALGDKVQYLSMDDLGGFEPIPTDVMQPVDGKQGFDAKYFARGSATPATQGVEPQLNFTWGVGSPDPKIPADGFRAVFTGKIIPPMSGEYVLRLAAQGEAWMFAGATGGAPTAIASRSRGISPVTALVQMQKGVPFYVRVEYTHQAGDASLGLSWERPDSQLAWTKVDEAARQVDAVVVVAGLDHNLDIEGRDRADIHFPPVQEALINRVAGLNPNTVVVMINGSPVELGGWLPHVHALVEAWYPGMEGGNAIADVLFGRIDPSGRIPFSWPKKLEDSPCRTLGTQTNDRVDYKEGLLVGYRYYDTKIVEPQFPFGYGLSYTTFSFGRLHIKNQKETVLASVDVKNTGKRDGIETVQIYVRPLKPSVSRPVHELKAFKKIAIKAGSSQTLDFTLGPEAFSYYDDVAKEWKVDAGPYEIQAGESSRNIRASSKIAYN